MDFPLTHFSFPTEIHYGPGSRRLLPRLLTEQGLSRPLLVTDQGLVDLPLIADIITLLKKQGLEPSIFSGIDGNPIKKQVLDGLKVYRSETADCIVMVGGGAPMDVGKAIALLVNHPGDLFDYEDGKTDALPTDQSFPYLIAVPTTAGTGSEVGRSAVVSDDESHQKKILFSPKMLPNQVISDAELTLYLPPGITAATGMDALTHLVEAYLADTYHPICDGIALEGLKIVARQLQKCVEFAKNPEVTQEQLHARSEMLMAAHMGAIAFQKGLGVNHSMAHALSTVCDLHHGLANGIVLPYTMEFNQQKIPEKFHTLCNILDINDFIQWIVDLKNQIGIPEKLSIV